MLEDTKLSTNVSPRMLTKIEKLGQVFAIGAGQELFHKGDDPDYLYVNLGGDIYIDNHPQPIWIGPGNIIGEVGFFTGIKRLRSAWAGKTGCTLWRIHRSHFDPDRNKNTITPTTHFLIGLAPHINIRRSKVLHDYAPDSSDNPVDNYCNHDHPMIQKTATLLRGKDDWDTAINVWEFVRTMPYRFGSWNQLASETLRMGYGMCTSKANLQVALLRALGIESQFGECQATSDYVIPFLPSSFRPLIKSTIKHYFCVVKLDGQWFPSDASFSLECIHLATVYRPEWSSVAQNRFTRGKGVTYGCSVEELEYEMKYDLNDVMRKRPFYKLDNSDVMNVWLDEAQGDSFKIVPHWVESVSELVNYAPDKAFQDAIQHTQLDTLQLYDTISNIDNISRKASKNQAMAQET